MYYTIPEDWLSFCDVPNWKHGSDYYPNPSDRIVEIVPLSDIEPPQLDSDMVPFKKYKMRSMLFAFQSPECALRPTLVEPLPKNVLLADRINQYSPGSMITQCSPSQQAYSDTAGIGKSENGISWRACSLPLPSS